MTARRWTLLDGAQSNRHFVQSHRYFICQAGFLCVAEGLNLLDVPTLKPPM